MGTLVKKIIEWANGKKTHIVALTMIVEAVAPFFNGDSTLGQIFAGENLRQILEGLGLSTLRMGVKKSGIK